MISQIISIINRFAENAMNYSLSGMIGSIVLYVLCYTLKDKNSIVREVLIAVSMIAYWILRLIFLLSIIHNGAGILAVILFIFFGGLTVSGLIIVYYNFMIVPIWMLVIFVVLDFVCMIIKRKILCE